MSLNEQHGQPGGAPALGKEAIARRLAALPDWELAGEGAIRRDVAVKDFSAAIRVINGISTIAEAEDHHPDLHLTRYRHLTIELSTHAVGGLSENDFIVAAKIDRLLGEGRGVH